jgi:tetrameric-type glycyl-tRNA synthetase beta subunit
VRIETPDKYEQKLLAASVVADRKKRKKSIHRQIDSLVQTKGLAVPEVAEGLYDVCTDLTEYPHAVLCSFEEYFLGLPPEVLISEMIEHQHYFPLISRTDKSLSNQFVVISNIEDNELSRYGYQRVLRARLADGAFFNSEDKKRNFADYLEKLKTVTFHEKLGSVYEKVQRIRTICTVLSDLLLLDAGKKAAILQTAALCKNDLVTLMINEFPNLQGIMGYYYAVASGFSEEVALGIKEHYFPRFAADLLPSGIEGAVVGMADRLDTIMGIFSIGIRPKGSRDPFALRRNVFALVKIIIDRKLNFSMRALLQKITSLYAGITTAPAVVDEIEDFIKSRIKSVFSDLGFLYDEIEASLSNVMEDIYEAYRRVLALHDFRSNRDFEDLLTSFKRMANITRDEKSFSFSEDSLVEKDEKELYGFFNGLRDSIRKNIELKKYDEVYRLLSTFKPYVDSFFDNVLVMDEDLELRKNRMGLLKEIINVFSDIIDIAKIVSQ